MNTLQESKAQRWRIVAILRDCATVLVYLGASITAVREGYQDSWENYIHPDVRTDTSRLVIQKWMGTCDHGKWIYIADLPLEKAA